MEYLSLALYAEGTTDYLFLSQLLFRVTRDMCNRRSRRSVDVTEVQAIDAPRASKPADLSRKERILRAVENHPEARLIFIHADADSDHRRSVSERINPARLEIESCKEDWMIDRRIVPVVPIRETEAWILADSEAIRQATGSRLSDSDLGLTRNPASVEKLNDPKVEVARVFERIIGKPSRRKRASDYFNLIGVYVDLDRLRLLTAFRMLETELETALRESRVLE